MAAAAVAGAGKCVLIKSVSRTDFPSSKTDSRRMSFGDIEILHTETLIKEVISATRNLSMSSISDSNVFPPISNANR